MSKPVFYVADLHGRTDSLEELLRAAGVLNPDGTRCHDVYSVQLGDLANVVREDRQDDELALDRALEGWFDRVLVGNHEHGFWGGPKFWGYDLMSTVADRIWKMDERGIWAPSHCVPELNLLVTHAGWARYIRLADYEGCSVTPADADSAHHHLTQAWEQDPTAAIFAQVGPARGGPGFTRCGGVLWSDWEEAKLQTFNQLVGHTTGDRVKRSDYRNGNWSLCIDTNAKRYGNATGALVDPATGDLQVITRPLRGSLRTLTARASGDD